jgi:hypothetical protein
MEYFFMIKRLALAALALSLTSMSFAYNPVNSGQITLTNLTNCSADWIVPGSGQGDYRIDSSTSVSIAAKKLTNKSQLNFNATKHDCNQSLHLSNTLQVYNGSNCSMDIISGQDRYRIDAFNTAVIKNGANMSNASVIVNPADCK